MGKHKWNSVKKSVDRFVNERNPSNDHRNLVFQNFKFINDLEPDFIAVGKEGFKGYIVFGFTAKDIYIMENTAWGNATYIFTEDWEELSKLSRYEIRIQKLHMKRTFHKRNWKRNLLDVLRKINHF